MLTKKQDIDKKMSGNQKSTGWHD